MREAAGPLAGRRIVVTRRDQQSGSLSAALRARGAEVVEAPAIAIVPPEDVSPLETALHHLERYDWVVFTSANAVGAVADRREGRPWPSAVKVASVGPTTARAITARLGVEVACAPAADFRAEGLLEALAREPLADRRVLLPASDRARPTLADGLRARGARVDVVVAYRTVVPAGGAESLRSALARGADAVVLASPSAVEGFLGLGGELARSVPAAVIGPVTERAARDAGLAVCAVASPSTAEGLLAALEARFARSPGNP